MERDEDPKSKFNAALAKLERISDIKKGIINARLANNYSHWKKLLENWRSEINERFNKENIAIADTYQNLIESSFNPCPLEPRVLGHAFSKIKPNPPNYKLIKFLLDKYELFLGKMEYKFGMSLPDDEDEEGL